MIKNIYIIQSHSLQALVKARQQIFTASPVSIRSLPHIITRFGTDDQFISVRLEIFFQQFTKISLCTSIFRSIIIRQVKVCDSMIKCSEHHLSHIFINTCIPKIMPESQRYLRQFQSAVSTTIVLHFIISCFFCLIHSSFSSHPSYFIHKNSVKYICVQFSCQNHY